MYERIRKVEYEERNINPLARGGNFPRTDFDLRGVRVGAPAMGRDGGGGGQ